MSFLTGTNMEVIAACSAPGAAVSVATGYTNITPGSGAAYLPIGFFNTNAVGKTLKQVYHGVATTPASATNCTFAASFDTSLVTASANQVGATASFPVTSSITAWFWTWDCEITVQSLTESDSSQTGTTANLIAFGNIFINSVAGPAATAGTFFTAGSTSVLSLSINSAYWLELAMKSTAATAGQNFTVERCTTYGCN